MSTSPTKLPPVRFYGVKSRRRYSSIKHSLEQQTKRLKEDKIPEAYHSRILGPSTRWQTFYRQQDALDFIKNKTEDLHVFAFETQNLGKQSGQRQFLVATFEVFWHFYSQLGEGQRHHYEVIPEGCPCKLYFDLEFHLASNPDVDGASAVETLIEYVCCWVKELYGVECCRQDVMELTASTESKFSRHLIFQSERTVFKDNIHAGGFIHSIFSVLEKHLFNPDILSNSKDFNEQSKNTNEDLCTEQTACGHSTKALCHLDSGYPENAERITVSYPSCRGTSVADQHLLVDSLSTETTPPKEELEEEITAVKVQGTVHPKANACHSEKHQANRKSVACRSVTDMPTPQKLEKKTPEIVGLAPHSTFLENEVHLQSTDTCTNKPKQVHSSTETSRENKDSDNQIVMTETVQNVCERVFQQFKTEELKSLFVKNQDNRDTCFADLGVYTKNRNFRLYKSRKLGKATPFTVAKQNTFTVCSATDNSCNSDKDVFIASLITNFRDVSKTTSLTFGDDRASSSQSRTRTKCHTSAAMHSTDELIEGIGKSPYPEVDDFMTKQVSGCGRQGSVRRWKYFPVAEVLSYDIVGYRFCFNIQRQHRSNNIKLIADLQKGVWYQKCYDPECQAVNFKSEEFQLPSGVLPSSYLADDFEELWEENSVSEAFVSLLSNKQNSRRLLSKMQKHYDRTLFHVSLYSSK